jgi:mRNA-degrading endonuclease HigB of HigAB toxin-antitoxin module
MPPHRETGFRAHARVLLRRAGEKAARGVARFSTGRPKTRLTFVPTTGNVARKATLAKFGKKYPGAAANWPYFPAVKDSFPATDYAASTGTLIFDIGGNKYRLIARVDFMEQVLVIQKVLTHEQYNRR